LRQEKRHASDQTAFQWLDARRGSDEWDRIYLAFQHELEPDAPLNVTGGTPVLAYKYKYIYTVGVFKTVALVVIGHRETKEDRSGDYFSAFTYDIRTGSKLAIENADVLWDWKLVKLAQFQPSITPDVAFTYLSCTECEEQTLLASFQYDSAKDQWGLRKWGRYERLLVSATPDPGGDTISLDCLYKINDWNADGYDDVAVWCKEVNRDARGKTKTHNSTTVYSFKEGHFSSAVLTVAEEITKVHAELCRDSRDSNLCKVRKNQ
jgi:hypothetical protein